MGRKKLLFWTALLAVLFFASVSVGCGNSSPTAPSGNTSSSGGSGSSSGSSDGSSSGSSGGTGDVYAPPPPGVPAEVWRVAFSSDGRLRRPEAVHLSLPPEADIAVWTAVVNQVNGLVQTKIDLVPGGVGATFPVSVQAGLQCKGMTVSGCTTLTYDALGHVIGQKMEYDSIASMNNWSLVMHEVFRTLGMATDSPVPGIMALHPTAPTEEEKAMFLAREIPPLLAMYSPS